MIIKENSPQHLRLIDIPWWMPVTGIVVATFCFWSAATQMDDYPQINRLGALISGLVFAGLFILAARKIKIHFDRAAGTITRTTEPLLPLGNIHLFRPRSESRPIDCFQFAFLERQLKHSGTASNNPQRDVFCLALATGEIPEDLLMGEIGFTSNPDKDKVRWLAGYNAGMKRKQAYTILSTVNRWLGTSPPQNSIH
jgi:hypothetical protein